MTTSTSTQSASTTPSAPKKPQTVTAWRQAKPSSLWLRPFRLLLGLSHLALRRLGYHPGLSFLALLGVIFAVGLVSSAAFFAQAVDQVILTQVLAEYSRITKRPPFSTRIYTFASRQIPLSLELAETLGRNVAETVTGEVGLPVVHLGLEADSGVMKLWGQAGSRYDLTKPIEDIHLMYMKEAEAHIQVTAGEPYGEGISEAVLDVWIPVNFAEEIGIQLGDEFDLRINAVDYPLPIRVQGLWQAMDPDEPFWFSDAEKAFQETFLVQRADYISHVEAFLPVKVRAVGWNLILDDTHAIPAQGRDYMLGFERSQNVISKYIPEARLTAPSLSLEKFVRRQDTLTILLLGFNIPAFGFLLYFLILTSTVIAYWQRRETAIMVSRGMTLGGVVTFTLIEEVILFIIGYPLGLAFGAGLARMMGYTVSFLSFSEREPLPISTQGINIPLTLFTLAIVLLARLLPAVSAARQSVIDQAREHTRPIQGPFWYRYYSDLLILIPTAYAYRQLMNSGSLATLVQDRPDDLYQDPLLVLVPALFILSAALLTMRLFPLSMRILDSLSSLTPWLTPHLALRQLGRQSQQYITPLILVIVSLALGVYTLSMAASLDQWLIDRFYYNVGADLTFEPYLEGEALSDVPGGILGAAWIPPHWEFGALPNVAASARVGDYRAEIKLATRNYSGRFLGIDRLDFPRVAWFRNDFASESLGGLMNRLAQVQEGILVSQEFLEDNLLRIGDRVTIHVITDYGASLKTDFIIVGLYDYFPTVYEDQVTVIGNLDYLFSFFGLPMPHNIWLRLQPGGLGETVFDNIPTTGIDSIDEKDTPALIDEAQAQMERVGVFGTLSVSFLAAAIMAAMGLLTYSYASMQERLFYFSVLHAIGVKRLQQLGQVILEYTVLTIYGAVAGAFIGSLASLVFIPLFRVGQDQGSIIAPLPPLLPIIAEEQIIPMALGFASLMILLELLVLSTVLYQRLFGILRLGHQG